METKNVLIIATHGLGDLVMLLPVLNAYDFTNLHVTFLLKGKAERDLLLSVVLPFRAEILLLSECNSAHDKYRLLKKLRLRKFLNIIPQVGTSYVKLSFLALLLRKVIFTNSIFFLHYFFFHKGGRNRHKVLVNDNIFRLTKLKYSVQQELIYPQLMISDDVKINFFDRSFSVNKHIVITPGSGLLESHKRWPHNKYALLIDQLLEIYHDITVSVVGSSSESELLSNIKSKCVPNSRLIFQSGTLSIPQLLLLLLKSDLVLSNCNGVSHLSALCQTHVIGLYGPTDPKYTGPFGVSFYPISLNLECSPCYKRGNIEGCGNAVCMSNISVAQVLNAINTKLIQ